jgi:hypothetical protein
LSRERGKAAEHCMQKVKAAAKEVTPRADRGGRATLNAMLSSLRHN